MKQLLKTFLIAAGLFYISACTTEEGLCGAGLEGSDCKTETRAKYIGAYQGAQLCTTGNDSIAVTFATVTGDYAAVDIAGLYITPGFTARGTTLPDGTIKIEEQAFGTGKISGLAVIENSKIKINYAVSDGLGGPADSCTWLQR